MFSLILTILSIVLVGLLAVATIYFMGSSVNERGPEAVAATVLAQSEQIYGALEIRKADGAGPIGSLSTLTTPDSKGQTYLDAIPVPPANAYSGAISSTTSDWVLLNPQAQRSSFALQTKLSKEVCHQINRKAIGSGDIHEAADPTRRVQCFGSAEPFTALFGYGSTLSQEIGVFNAVASAPIVAAAGGGIVAFIDPQSTPATPVTPPSTVFEPVLSALADPRSTISTAGAIFYSQAVPSPTTGATATVLSVLGGADFQTYCKTEGGEEVCDSLNKPTVSYVAFNYNVLTITNTTLNSVLVLGAVPTVSESTPFGAAAPVYAEMLSLAGRQGALVELLEFQNFANTIGSDFYESFRTSYALSFPTYNLPPLVNDSTPVSLSGLTNLCGSGQVLNPGQSCQLYTDDVAPFNDFLVALDTGVEIPFAFGATAATATIPGKFIVVN